MSEWLMSSRVAEAVRYLQEEHSRASSAGGEASEGEQHTRALTGLSSARRASLWTGSA